MSDKQISPCRFFRTKGYYMSSQAEETLLNHSNVNCYWCLRTMTNIGPDNDLAVPENCRSERKCFELDDKTCLI